jgi:hypothetical protein
MQIDTNRVLRSDEYLVGGGATGMAMGGTTVSYYVAGAAGMAPSRSMPVDPFAVAGSMPVGLVRRESNRTVAVSSNPQQNQLEPAAERIDVLAPEVVGLEFRYFDGMAWLPQWNAEELQSSPKAVEILLAIGPKQQKAAKSLFDWSGDAAGFDEVEFFRLVVQLPGSVAGAELPATDAPLMEPAP